MSNGACSDLAQKLTMSLEKLWDTLCSRNLDICDVLTMYHGGAKSHLVLASKQQVNVKHNENKTVLAFHVLDSAYPSHPVS